MDSSGQPLLIGSAVGIAGGFDGSAAAPGGFVRMQRDLQDQTPSSAPQVGPTYPVLVSMLVSICILIFICASVCSGLTATHLHSELSVLSLTNGVCRTSRWSATTQWDHGPVRGNGPVP